MAFTPQHLHAFRYIPVKPPVKGGIAGDIRIQFWLLFPYPHLGILQALLDGMLTLIQAVIKECLPDSLMDVTCAFSPFSTLICETGHIILPNCFPFSI